MVVINIRKQSKIIDLSKEFEKQKEYTCSETSASIVLKKANKNFDYNKDDKSDQNDIIEMNNGECFVFWTMLPCLNKFLDCSLKRGQTIEQVLDEIDNGRPVQVRIHPPENPPGVGHTIIINGYENFGNTLIITDPAQGIIKKSKEYLLKNWVENAAIYCKEK